MLGAFLNVTQLASSFGASVAGLVELGFFEPACFEREVREVEKLSALEEELSELRSSWGEAVSVARQEAYMLSFFCSQQLYQLFLGLCASDAGAAEPSDLLQYVPAARA